MLKAGFSAIDITPPTANSLMGYEFRQAELPPGNAGAHDRLLARALVLEDAAGTRVLLVTLDLCILTVALARKLRASLAAKAGIAPERVVLACSHTHSGPLAATEEDADRWGGFLSGFVEAGQQNPDAAYSHWLEGRLLEATASAGGLLTPVTLGVAAAPLGLAYNRRVMTAEGVRHCWNPQESPALHPEPAIDPACTVAVLRQASGPRSYVIWSLGAHAVTLGKTSRVVSADWPGRACALVEEYLPGARGMFLQGASGDAHPWVATQEDPAQLEPVARAAASMVALLSQATRAAEADPLISTAFETFTEGKSELDLAVWRIGPVYLAAAPVELFGQPAVDLRGRLNAPLLLATCANGWTGYWPSAQAFEEGGYEVNGAKHFGYEANSASRLVERLANLAGEANSSASARSSPRSEASAL